MTKINDRKVLQKVKSIIEEAQASVAVSSLRHLKKLRGYETFYRITTGDYRIGVEIINDEIIFTRFSHRKEIYKYFP